MKLQRIYSSKLYVTSTRKDKIHAAINDPINVELVRQLSEYLDEEGQQELKQAVSEEKGNQVTTDNSGSGESSGSSTSSGSEPASFGSASSHNHFTGNIMDDFGEDDLADIEPMPTEDDAPTPTEEPTPESTESTTKIPGKAITANSIIWTTVDDVINDSETIKGTLNSREDTKGVSRLQIKENELWIYFNDDENLNDKMVDVIELLNATGYTYLAFSRLARSNNAIVFDINLNAGPIKSIQEVEEEIKDAK